MQHVEEGQEFAEAEVDVSTDQSLSARMAQRAEELEKQTTERFPIPGYEGVLEVELRALGYKTIRKVIKRNEKVRDEGLREIYTMADQLIVATVGFWETKPDGEDRELKDYNWVRAAKLVPGCPDDPTQRQALLYIVTDKRIAFLLQEWGNWSKAVRPDLDEEVEQDFAVTG